MNPPQLHGHGVAGTVTTAAAVTGGGGGGTNGDMLRRNLSPVTVGRPGKAYIAGPGNNSGRGGGTGKHHHPPTTHYVPLPPHHHPSENVDMQITELAALNDILFGPEGEDPGLAQARAAAAAAAAAAGGIAFERQKGGVTLAALEPAGMRSSGGGGPPRCAGNDSGGGGGGGGRGNENGRLPSIAGLVAAGALLNGGEWRSCRQPASFAFVGPPSAKCD